MKSTCYRCRPDFGPRAEPAEQLHAVTNWSPKSGGFMMHVESHDDADEEKKMTVLIHAVVFDRICDYCRFVLFACNSPDAEQRA